MQTFAEIVVLAGLPQADQRGKQNLLQLKLKIHTFLAGVAENSTELSWSSGTDSDLTHSYMHCTIKKSSSFCRSCYFVLNQLFTDISLSYSGVTEFITVACAMLSVSAALFFAGAVFMVITNKTKVKLLSHLESVYKDTQITFMYH